MISARYRAKDDQEHWPLGDPIERLKQYLIRLGEWSDERHRALSAELEALVAASWAEAVTYGTMSDGPKLDADLMFEDVFKEMPQHLIRQRAQMRAERDAAHANAAARPAGAPSGGEP